MQRYWGRVRWFGKFKIQKVKFKKRLAKLEKIKEAFRSPDMLVRDKAHEDLRILGGDSPLFYIPLLELDNSYNLLRNEASRILSEIGDNIAVDPLFRCILKKENIGYNGSQVYALESFDCSLKFTELFEILFYHGLEAKLSAHSILTEQEFLFTNEDLTKIKDTWQRLKSEFTTNDMGYKMIEDAVDTFVIYLND